MRRQRSPGSLHHVWSRGLSRRRIFETSRDHRYFLTLLARATRDKQFRMVSYALLTNHYHLLLECNKAELSAGMQWVLSQFVRRFNFGQRRDGPLFRARFHSRPVEGETDIANVVRYVDINPVKAGLARTPASYDWGSARFYSRGQVPVWLAPDAIEMTLRCPVRDEKFPSVYKGLHKKSLSGDWRIERRLELRGKTVLEDGHSLDAFVKTPTNEGLRASCLAADGRLPVRAWAHPSCVVDAVSALDWPEYLPGQQGRGPRVRTERTVLAGLLHYFSALGTEEISERLGVSQSTVSRSVQRFASLVEQDTETVSAALHALRQAINS